MEDLKNLEKIAKENLELAIKEKELAGEFNLTGIKEYKRAKIRRELAEKNIKLNLVRQSLAKKYGDLLEKKTQNKNNELLEFSEEEIKFEKDYSDYLELINNIQIEISEIQVEMANLEIDISADKIKISHETEYSAKEREKLGNIQLDYIKVVMNKKSEKKISRLYEKYMMIQETLNRDRKDVLNDLKILKQKEIRLADLKKLLSLKLSEREKIRPKNINMPSLK